MLKVRADRAGRLGRIRARDGSAGHGAEYRSLSKQAHLELLPCETGEVARCGYAP